MKGRLLVVSHACVVDVNQSLYGELAQRGWTVQIVVPRRWKDDYRPEPFAPMPLSGLEGMLLPVRVLFPGLPQRHLYVANSRSCIRRFSPDVIFIEEECFSVPALQWSRAARRSAVPFGVQAYENLDRPLPLAARAIRRSVLGHAAFVAARSPSAKRLVKQWGAIGKVELAPPAVPLWPANDQPQERNRPFTVGFAGRLVPEKGVEDLLGALRLLKPPARLLVAGDGPLRTRLKEEQRRGAEVQVLTGVAHDDMWAVFPRMDVLVLPSRTTPTWAEQFGRVLVEALSQSVPVVGADSGEIPWVISATGGGITVPEGDVSELSRVLGWLRDDPVRRARLGARGREAVMRLFSVSAAADKLEGLLLETCR